MTTAVYPLTKDLSRKIEKRFLKVEYFRDVLSEEDSYLPFTETKIGLSTTTVLNKLVNECDIEETHCIRVMREAQVFYRKSLEHVLTKMDSKNEFWVHIVRIHFFNRIDAKLEDVYYLVDIYQTILNFTEKDYDQMYYEFRDFTTLSDDKINIQEELRTQAINGNKEYGMDAIWYILQTIKSFIGNKWRARTLLEVAKNILITPHSYACIERVYLLNNKNKCQGWERNGLGFNGTLSSILEVKLNKP